jgi:hypothetical protein
MRERILNMCDCGYALKFEQNVPVSAGYNMTYTNALRKLGENESVFFPCKDEEAAKMFRYDLMASLRYLRKIGDISYGRGGYLHGIGDGQKVVVTKENCSFGVRVYRLSK